jgi:hypothetical protein
LHENPSSRTENRKTRTTIADVITGRHHIEKNMVSLHLTYTFSVRMTAANFGAKTTTLEIVKGLTTTRDGKLVLITNATSGKHVLRRAQRLF